MLVSKICKVISIIYIFVQVFIGLRSSLIRKTARQAKNPNALAILYNESATCDIFSLDKTILKNCQANNTNIYKYMMCIRCYTNPLRLTEAIRQIYAFVRGNASCPCWSVRPCTSAR